MSVPIKIYISGKITGLDRKVAESRFDEAMIKLCKEGYNVCNPFLIDHNHDQSWESFMLADLKLLFECQAVYMLNNWKSSKGARIEHYIALERGLKVIYQP